MSRTRRLRTPLFLSLALAATACTKKEGAKQDQVVEAPTEAEIEPEAEIRRDYPETTVFAATMVEPGKLMDAVVEMSSPGYKWRPQLDELDPNVVKAIDFDAPVDMLFGYLPKTQKGERFVISFGVADAAALEALLAKSKFTVTKPGNGVALSFAKDPITCELPESAKRVHCWHGEQATAEEYLTALDARKATTGAPRIEFILDGDYLRGPLKPDMDGMAAMAKMFGPQSLEQVKDPQLKTDATKLITDSVDGFMEFTKDLDRAELTVGLTAGNKGVYSRGRVRLLGRQSTMAKLLDPKYHPVDVAPELMMKLPADVNNATYVLGNKEPVPEPATAYLALLKSTLLGGTRELGVYDPTLDPVLDAIFSPPKADYTVTVQPRTPAPKVDSIEDLQKIQGAPMVWVYPHDGQSQVAAFEKMAEYLNSQPVKKMLEAGMGASVDKLVKVEDIEGMGKVGKRLTFHLPKAAPGSVEAQMLGAYADADISIIYIEDETLTWMGAGGHSDIMLDYIKRGMAGQGPTLADDPRAAYLGQQKAWYATYTPVDPTYIADFVKEIFKNVAASEMSGSEEAKVLEAIEEVSAAWTKLPASAMQTRAVADKEGLMWEMTAPQPVMQMMGDVITAIAKQANKDKAPAEPVVP